MGSGQLNIRIHDFSERLGPHAEVCIVAALGVLLSALMVFGQSWMILVLMMILAVPVVLYRWPYGALVSLIVATAMPRYTGKILGLTVKPEHLITAVVIAVMISVHRSLTAKLQPCDFFLIAFFGANFVSSVFGSPDIKATVTHAILFSVVALPYWIILRLVNSAERLSAAFKAVLAVGVAEASFGILCWLAHVIVGTELGITRYTYLGNLPGLHGSQWEPNIFGSYVGSCVAMFTFVRLNRMPIKLSMVGLALTGIATMLSMARAAWLGLLPAFLFVLVGSRRSAIEARKVWKSLLGFLMAGLVVIGLVFLITPLRERVVSLAPSSVVEDTTLIHRVVYLAHAVEDIQSRPWFGYGTESFELLWSWETLEKGEVGAWVGNVFIRVLHDTGIVGLTLFGFFLWFLLQPAYVAWKRNKHAQIGKMAGALIASQIVLMVAYQFTEATLLSFTWLYFGLIAAAVRLAGEQAAPLYSHELIDPRSREETRIRNGGELLEGRN